MNKLALLIFCLLTMKAQAYEDVLKQIVRNKPNIDTNKAINIAKIVNKIRSKYNLPREVLPAILMQESSYRVEAINRVTHDYGMSQINRRTIQAFRFNTVKLTTDTEYSIEAAAIILQDLKKRYGNKEKTWFTRYNTNKPELRQKYLNSITRWMSEEQRKHYAH